MVGARWLGVLIVVATSVALADVSARFDDPLIDEMDTTRLIIRVDGAEQPETLQLAVLGDAFDVLGTSTDARVRRINGREQRWLEYRVQLRPTRSGILRVPPLTLHGERTAALDLRVTPVDPALKQAIQRQVFFRTSVSRERVYVQAETVMTRRLYYADGVQLFGDQPGAPQLPNAVVVPLGEIQSSSIAYRGEPYSVITQRFAIFPEHSGQLRVPGVSVSASIPMRGRGFSRPRATRRSFRAVSPAVVLEVMPIPSVYPPEQPWLPARNVQLQQSLVPASGVFEVGSPGARALRVVVTGNTGSVIPPIPMHSQPEFFRQYPQPPSIQDRRDSIHLIGERTQREELLPLRGGRLALQAVALTWWDTEADRLRVASVDPVIVTLAGNAPDEDAPPLASTAPQLVLPGAPASNHGDLEMRYAWLIAALVLVAALLAAAAVVRVPWRLQRSPHPHKLGARLSLWRACRDGSARRIKAALETFAAAYDKDAGARAVAHLRARSAPLARQIDRLNELLYAAAAGAAADAGDRKDAPQGPQFRTGAELYAAAVTSIRTERRPTPPLPELYPG